MNPTTSSFIMDACGAASTTRRSPGAASPNWKALASNTMVSPAAVAETSTPRNFTFCCSAGVEPSQYPVLKSVIACPDTASAVHTMPAMAITKNIPVGPDMPNRRSTTLEMMMVSMVMPEIGFRAVVAMALAATDVKKKENNNASSKPLPMAAHPPCSVPRTTATASADRITPSRTVIMDMSRSVRTVPAGSP